MLNELAKEIHENAKAHGWWDDNRTFPEIVALDHSELSEALEEYRNARPMVYCENPDCRILQNRGTTEDTCCNVCGFMAGKAKPEGIATEMADCIIRILDWAVAEGIDMDAIILAKMDYNKTRPYWMRTHRQKWTLLNGRIIRRL